MRLISPLQGRFAVHVDLHETTDTDESEFSPRGLPGTAWPINRRIFLTVSIWSATSAIQDWISRAR